MSIISSVGSVRFQVFVLVPRPGSGGATCRHPVAANVDIAISAPDVPCENLLYRSWFIRRIPHRTFSKPIFQRSGNLLTPQKDEQAALKKIPHVTEKSQTTSIAQKLCLSMTLVNIPARKKHLFFRIRANHAKHCKH
jgi:hypothetical protein